jgi:positive regulator of sigma E activity
LRPRSTPVRKTQLNSQSDCQLTADAVVIAARPDGLVDLEFSSASRCAACAGTCLWKRLQAARLDRLPVAMEMKPGTEVTVALAGRRVLLASVLLHGVPLAAILAGAAIGSLMTGTDTGTLIGSVCAIAVVVAGFRHWRDRLERATFSSLVVTPKS